MILVFSGFVFFMLQEKVPRRTRQGALQHFVMNDTFAESQVSTQSTQASQPEYVDPEHLENILMLMRVSYKYFL